MNIKLQFMNEVVVDDNSETFTRRPTSHEIIKWKNSMERRTAECGYKVIQYDQSPDTPDLRVMEVWPAFNANAVKMDELLKHLNQTIFVSRPRIGRVSGLRVTGLRLKTDNLNL